MVLATTLTLVRTWNLMRTRQVLRRLLMGIYLNKFGQNVFAYPLLGFWFATPFFVVFNYITRSMESPSSSRPMWNSSSRAMLSQSEKKSTTCHSTATSPLRTGRRCSTIRLPTFASKRLTSSRPITRDGPKYGTS